MNRVSLSALVVLLMVYPAVAQKPIAPPPAADPPSRSRIKSNQFEVIVKGCVRNGRLERAAFTSDPQVDTLRASEFILEGPRELMQQIRSEHNGHYDEIAGIVTVPTTLTGGTSDVATKKLGPVRIGVGNRTDGGVVEAPRPLRLKVASLTHLNEGCVAQR
jgi:hypothetical protein